MAFTTEPNLVITDGVNTVTIMSSAATTDVLKNALTYRLAFGEWGPKVAVRNDNPLGLPYLPVMEEMTINIKAATPSACYTALQVLNSLLDQADRWWNNEIVNPVVIKYQPKGSNISTFMQDVIMGGSANDQNAEMMTLPDDINYGSEVSYLKGIKIKFWRRNGLWLSETETVTVAAKTVETTYVPSAWSKAAPQLAPLDIGFQVSGTLKSIATTPSGFVLVAQRTEYITLYEGAQGVTALSLTGTTNTADTTAQATNGAVGRLALNTTDTSAVAGGTSANMNECEYNAVYMTCRLSASATVIARIEISFNTAFVTDLILPDVTIPYNGGLPQAIFLGLFPTDAINYTQITIFCKTTLGAINFDIDEFIVIGVNRATGIIGLPFITALGGAGLDQVVRGRLLTKPNAFVGFPAVSTPIKYSYSGSPYFYTGNSTRTSVAMYLLLPYDAFWRPVNAANTALNISASFTRLLSHLTPE